MGAGSEERPQKAKSFLGDKSIILPGYYGQRFAGRRQAQSEAPNDYGYDVPRSEKAAEGMRDARWNSDFLQGGDLPEGWKVGGSGSTASALGFNGEYLTAKCGPQRSDCAEWMTAKDLRRKGRPSAAHTCTATRREEHERSLEAEMNPRVGAVYEVSKRRVPTLEQRRNGIPFVSHGDKLYKKPEMLVGFHLTPKDGPGLRKFMAAHPPRASDAPSAGELRERGLRKMQSKRREEVMAEVRALDDWTPAGQPEPALTETPTPSRPASGKGGTKSRPASGANGKKK